MRRTLRTILSIALLLVLSGFTLKACKRPPKEAMRPIELTWWRVFDDFDALAPALDTFRAQHPNIIVNYRRLRFEEYEDELLNALAEDRGPDIVSLHNTWIGKYQSKLLPSPPSITLPFTYVTGSLKKEKVTEMRRVPTLTAPKLRERYLDAVTDDVLRIDAAPGQPPAERIFGLPLSVDTLVLFYNRDLLNAAGLPQPARVWSEFQEHVKRLTKISGDKIMQAGAGIGAYANVPRAVDLLAVLMMQNGAVMSDERGNVLFAQVPPDLQDRGIVPAEEALAFYTDFANPTKEVYTWDTSLPDAFDLFAQGRLAYFFGYSYHLPLLRSRAPKLRFGLTRIPQIEENPEMNFANYWVESVSKKTKNPEAAWGLIQFVTEEKNVRDYLTRAKRPPPLRSLIAEFSEDPDLGVFTQQLLTAKSWYRGVNAGAAERILGEMIESIVKGEDEISAAIGQAANRVQQTIRQ